MDFENKVILITGASAGIGAATAKLYSTYSGKLALVGRNKANLKKVADECELFKGIKPLIIVADVSVVESLKRIVDETVDHFGGIDVLINNAGIALHDSIRENQLEEVFNPIIETNLRSIYVLTHYALPHLLKSKGNIVNVSSNASTIVFQPLALSYSMAKAALDQFTRIVAYDLGPDGVRVNSVNPGITRSNILGALGLNDEEQNEMFKSIEKQYPLGKAAECEDIANDIVYLSSELAKNITGLIMVSDGGRSLGTRMPTVWESSLKPLYVRSIEVNGLPYNILSHEDFQKFRQTRTVNSSANLKSNNSRTNNKENTSRPVSFTSSDKSFLKLKRIFNGNKDDKNSDIKLNIDKFMTSISNITESDSSSRPSNETFAVNVKTEELHPPIQYTFAQRKLNKSTSSTKKNSKQEQNELSERVIEWLDLANKKELLWSDSSRWNMQRHSYPEVHNRVPNFHVAKQAVDQRKSVMSPELNIDYPENPVINVPFSRDDIAPAEKSLQENQPTVKSLNDDLDMIQNKYSRFLLERESFSKCDPSLRKQVHIFIPTLPKKHSKASSTLSDSTGCSR